MIYSKPERTTARRIPAPLIAGLLAIAALAAALCYPLLAFLPSTAASPTAVPPSERPRPPLPSPQAASEAASPIAAPPSERPQPQLPPPQAAGEAVSPITAPPSERPGSPLPSPQAAGEAAAPIGLPPRELRGALGEADGAVPEWTTVFDDEIPAVANLDPALLAALRRAAMDAANDGVMFFVTSGWRSPAYQEQLLREAIAKYGSEAEAARWVATADTSPHVSGDAIDIGPSDATAWLSRHGAEYGLCQIYRNEPWHFELRPEAVDYSCPPMYADPTHDPRMQQ